MLTIHSGGNQLFKNSSCPTLFPCVTTVYSHCCTSNYRTKSNRMWHSSRCPKSQLTSFHRVTSSNFHNICQGRLSQKQSKKALSPQLMILYRLKIGWFLYHQTTRSKVICHCMRASPYISDSVPVAPRQGNSGQQDTTLVSEWAITISDRNRSNPTMKDGEESTFASKKALNGSSQIVAELSLWPEIVHPLEITPLF